MGLVNANNMKSLIKQLVNDQNPKDVYVGKISEDKKYVDFLQMCLTIVDKKTNAIVGYEADISSWDEIDFDKCILVWAVY